MSRSLAVDAARRAFRDLNDGAALASNPLLARHANDRDAARARLLRAVEALEPGVAQGSNADRRRRQHAIVLRCDVRGDSHKSVMAALGISRRQFYRDRSEALAAIAEWLTSAPAAVSVEVRPDLLGAQVLYVERLRACGNYEAVWRESLALLRAGFHGEREVELWTVASEAARYVGNIRRACEALEQGRQVAATSPHEHLWRASAMRVAIAEIALQWAMGDGAHALEAFHRVVADIGDEREMYGRDATMFGILLDHGAAVSIEAGAPDRAAAYLGRAEHIADRSRVPQGSSALHRLRGRIAQRFDGDLARAIVEFREALAIAQKYGALPLVAAAAVELGLALTEQRDPEATEFLHYGLTVGRDMCGYDDFAVLISRAAPAIAQAFGTDDAMRRIDDVRARSPLGERADLYARLATADLHLQGGNVASALKQGQDLGQAFERGALLPAAAHARLISAEAFARTGRNAQAKRALHSATELIHAHGDAAVRARAARLGTLLAPAGAVV